MFICFANFAIWRKPTISGDKSGRGDGAGSLCFSGPPEPGRVRVRVGVSVRVRVRVRVSVRVRVMELCVCFTGPLEDIISL